jgi:O-antigen/teichoic acid export membrane protein
VFTKYYSLLEVGQFAFALAIAAPIYALLNLQLKVIQASDINNNYDVSSYFVLRLLTVVISTILLLIIGYLFSPEAQLVLLTVCLWRAIESMSDIVYGYYQKHEVMDLLGKSLILKSVSAVAVVLFLASSGCSIEVTLFGIVIAWCLIFYTYEFPKYRQLMELNDDRLQFRKVDILASLPKLVRMSIPMGLVVLVHNLNLNVPKYAVEAVLGEADLAIFASIAYITVAGATLVSAIGQPAIPRLAHYYYEQKSKFGLFLGKITGMVIVIGLIGYLVSAILGEELLRVLYTEEYALHSDLFEMIMISSAFIYITSIMGCALTAMNIYKGQLYNSALCLLGVSAASFVLVPNYGMVGAAAAIGVGFLLNAIANIVLIAKELKFK